ncbi:uncharacterized protein [Rutidosis leptorrhynchoides]
MLRDSSGFYTYAIYEHLEGFPAFELDNTRIALKLNKEMFRYMAITDNRKRRMPLPEDRKPPRGEPLAYPEAVLLVDPVEPEFQGEVDDKYEYSIESKDNLVHGWISSNPPMGFWQINPSSEFRSAGPLKQNLASHLGPTFLAIFHSTHYTGLDLIIKIEKDENWKKVYGPVFYYLNSLNELADPTVALWEDAKKQRTIESKKWPYDFPASKDFTKSNQRGSISGRLLVRERELNKQASPASDAYIGLAAPGNAGSWQFEGKGYQFWTKVNEDGSFSIENVRTGDYNLYAFVHGYVGDYKYETAISVTPGSSKNLGDLLYELPRNGPTLWEIGVPDRTASEFYIPDPNPKYVNKLYKGKSNRYRQYGLWERYAELYPDKDLVFTVGKSNYSEDWYYAQNTRKKDNNTYEGTTWQIKFTTSTIDKNGTYTLMLSLATAHDSILEVYLNDPKAIPLYSTGIIGHDNTIARHGIHGVYRLYTVNIPGSQLVEGENTIFLSQTRNTSPFQGIMYDYIRLESPPNYKN